MPRPDEVEEILSRLMPSAMSEEGEASVVAAIDVLADDGMTAEFSATRRVWRWGIGTAAAVSLSVLWLLQGTDEPLVGKETVLKSPQVPSVVPLGQSDVVKSIHEEGWHEDENGDAHQAVRVKLVARQEILDSETGIRMTVTEPREELLLVPVYAF